MPCQRHPQHTDLSCFVSSAFSFSSSFYSCYLLDPLSFLYHQQAVNFPTLTIVACTGALNWPSIVLRCDSQSQGTVHTRNLATRVSAWYRSHLSELLHPLASVDSRSSHLLSRMVSQCRHLLYLAKDRDYSSSRLKSDYRGRSSAEHPHRC